MTETELKIKVSSDSGTLAGIKQAEQLIRKAKAESEKAAKVAAELGKQYNLTAAEVQALAKRLEEIGKFDLDANGKLRDAQGRFVKIREELEAAAGSLANLSTETKAFVAAISGGLAAGIGALFKGGIEGFAQFEQYQTILETALGSAAEAEKALEGIEQFASSTPFQLDEVVEGFIKLQNRGIKPTNDVLRQLGDLASSQGKSLDQVVEAVLDAQTGEFERLKEFGITAKTTGDQVTLAFKGVEQTVSKTPEALTEAVLALGSLEGVAGQMAAQSEILVGRFSNLQDEAGKTSRIFGEFAANGARPVVEGAIALLQAFNSLPAPIQKALVASTAFVGVLAAATAAIAAYNLANGQAVVSELAKSAALIKSNAALAAKTVTTQVATTVQAAYAAATGKATAAQLAQTQALVAGAVTAAAFAGAIASIALVIDTFQKTTAAARELEQGTRDVEDALINLRKSGESVDLEVLGDEAAQNAERLAEELGGVQKALDGVRAALGFDTAAEAATNRAIVAFGELSSTVGEVEGEAINLAEALQQGLEVDPSKLEASISAIESSIAALEAAQPVTEIDIQLKDAQIERLERLKATLDEAANGTDELSDSTGDLSNQIKALTDDLQTVQSELEATALAQEAAIQEAAASGVNSLEQSQRSLAATEQQLLQDRISAARSQIAELEALKAGAGTPEAVAEINAQILQVENQLNRDRIKLAQQALDARTEAAEAAAKREADALKQFREDEARQQQQDFDDAALQRERAEDDRSRRDEQAFNDAQQQAEAAFQKSQQAAEDAFRKGQEVKAEAFQKSQQSDADAFRKGQEAEARRFQSELQAERDRGNQEFDALASEVERRVALANASSREERQQLEEQFEAAEEAARQRREIEQDVLNDRGQVISEAERNGELGLSPLEQARADFEAGLQAKQEEFQAAQQAAEDAFQAQQQAKAQAFEDGQRALEQQFEQSQQAAEEAFNQAQQDQEREFKDEQRQLEQDFADAERDRERFFKDEQRRLDRQNAQDVAAILNSARGSGIDGARKDGGPVKRGGTYLVGEAGPELITPSRNGYVHTAKETAALMNPSSITSALSPGQFAAVSTRRLEQQMQTLIDEVRSSRQVQMSPAQYILQTKQPARDAAEIEMTRLRNLARRVGLG